MKIVFIDADGTLMDAQGRVPESALQAIAAVRAAGNKVILSTGRQMVEIYGGLRKPKFDGMITGAGSLVQADGQVLEEDFFSRREKKFLAGWLKSHNVPAVWECQDSLYGTAETIEAVRSVYERECQHLSLEQQHAHGLYRILSRLQQTEDFTDLPACKISWLCSPLSFLETFKALAANFSIVPSTYEPFGEGAGEIGLLHLSKGEGVKKIADFYGVPLSDCIAIGDSHNDLPMFEMAGFSAAMGNAGDGIKKRADLVGPALDQDGLAAILHHPALGLFQQ